MCGLRQGELIALRWRDVKWAEHKISVTFEPSDTAVATERRRAAIERTSGMLAKLAPGASLADELVADRQAEVRNEEQADAAERRRGRS